MSCHSLSCHIYVFTRLLDDMTASLYRQYKNQRIPTSTFDLTAQEIIVLVSVEVKCSYSVISG